jgi:hypothetical protein
MVLSEDEEWLGARGVARVPLNLLVVVYDQESSPIAKAIRTRMNIKNSAQSFHSLTYFE